MATNPTISLVFVNYRSARHLAGALESLFSFESAAHFFEVIVVNNDPSESPALQTLRESLPFALIESGWNIGFGRANNLGAAQAHGRFLAFINPDVLWTGRHLQKIAGFLDDDPKTGVLGMALLGENGRPEAWSAGREPGLMQLLRNNLPFASCLQREAKDPAYFDWVSGGALFIRRGLFSEIKGFDQRFFLYFEDVDLCTEVRKRGFSIARSAAFPIIHLGGKSHSLRHIQKKHYFASQRRYFEKRRPRWENKALTWLQFIFCRT